MRPNARTTAIATMGCVLALEVNLVTWLAAARWNLAGALDPASFFRTHPNVNLLRLSLGADFASYVLIAVLVVHLETGVLSRTGGLAYSIVGASGAAILTAGWPRLLSHGTQATFTALTEVVYHGLWKTVAVTGLGVWLAGTARRTTGHRLTRLLAVVGSAAAFIDATLVLAGAFALSKVALGVLGAVVPAWFIAVTIRLWTQPVGDNGAWRSGRLAASR